jgi:hypothetical protein
MEGGECQRSECLLQLMTTGDRIVEALHVACLQRVVVVMAQSRGRWRRYRYPTHGRRRRSTAVAVCASVDNVAKSVSTAWISSHEIGV